MAKSMAKQMELFDDGGLMDEGGTTDPVSGNEVPPGSTQEEVRDDIPAQLSEGEFVFPADVVRYIGLENLMRMRQEAKQGLAEMEAMGQMGNSEEAIMPDNLPFDEYDLEVEDDGQDELNFQVGGYVPPSPPNQVNPITGVYQTGSTGITGYQGYQGQPTGFTPYGGATPFFQPAQFTGPQFTTALQTTNLPTFAETVGSKAGQYDELKTYQNDAGQTLQIPFKNGQPIYPIPEGYKPIEDQPKPKEEETTVAPVAGQAQVRDDGGKDPDEGKSTQTQIGWGGRADPNKPGLKTDVTMVDFSVLEAPGMLPGVAGTLAVAGQALMGKDYPDDAKLGISVDGVTTTITGTEFNQAKKAGYMGKLSDDILDRAQVNAATVNSAISRYGISKNPYGNKTFDDFMGEAARSDVGIEELAEEYGFDFDSVKDNPFGFGKNYSDAVDKAVEAANKGRKSTYVDRLGVTRVSDDPFSRDDIIAGHKARTRAKAMADAIKAKAEKGELTAGQIEQAKIDAALAKSGEQKGSGVKDEAEATAQSEAFERDTGASVGGDGRSGTDATGSTGIGTGTDCLTEKMKVKLNGVIDFVTNIKVGDMIDGSVVKEVLHKHMRSGYFVINNELEITNDHPVLANGAWTKPEELYIGDYINDVKVESIKYIDRMTPTVSIIVDGDSFDVYTEGNTYTVHGRYREVRQQAA